MGMAGIIASALLGVAAASAGDALPYTVPMYDVTVEMDVTYCVTDGYWTEGPDHGIPSAGYWTKPLGPRHPLGLKMDIYTPIGNEHKTRPLLLMMHGGAYLIGSKDETGQKEWCKYFASLGYVAVSIGYRLGFPLTRQGILKAEADALDDARTALGFLLGRSDLRIDPDRIFAAGTSAGGALALGLAYASPDIPCRIRAIGNLWGYVRDLSVLENANVPILSFQSEQDPVVPYHDGYPLGIHLAGRAYGTLAVHEKATALGILSEHVPCPEKAHRLHLDKDGVLTSRFYDIRNALASFFAQQIQ